MQWHHNAFRGRPVRCELAIAAAAAAAAKYAILWLIGGDESYVGFRGQLRTLATKVTTDLEACRAISGRLARTIYRLVTDEVQTELVHLRSSVERHSLARNARAFHLTSIKAGSNNQLLLLLLQLKLILSSQMLSGCRESFFVIARVTKLV